MNAEQLLQNFDRIAESPGSIAHLRQINRNFYHSGLLYLLTATLDAHILKMRQNKQQILLRLI
jgi:hypothetical protein